jgi:hypothetical protein
MDTQPTAVSNPNRSNNVVVSPIIYYPSLQTLDLITQRCSNLLRMDINMLVWIGIKAEEIKTNFDQDTFFKRINFELKPSEKEEELFILSGNFRQFVQ